MNKTLIERTTWRLLPEAPVTSPKNFPFLLPEVPDCCSVPIGSKREILSALYTGITSGGELPSFSTFGICDSLINKIANGRQKMNKTNLKQFLNQLKI